MLLAGVTAQGQTVIPAVQLRESLKPIDGMLLIVTSAGGLARVQVGAGLRLDFSGTVPTLVATATPPPPSEATVTRFTGSVATRLADGSFLVNTGLSAGSVRHLVVTRNGVRQKATAAATQPDYSIDPANTRRFIPRTAWGSDEDILADFEVVSP
jgi:hypothetical protein